MLPERKKVMKAKKKRRKGLSEKVGPCSQKRGLNVSSVGAMRGDFLEGLRFLQ
jgi:hypothetical protein